MTGSCRALLWVFLLLWPTTLLSADETLPSRTHPLIIDRHGGAVLLYAEVTAGGLATTNPHWGVVAVGGRFADRAILLSFAGPLELHDALLELGAEPGDNLTPRSEGLYPAGSSLEVTATWPGLGKPLFLGEIISDSGRKGFEIRFAGNRPAAETEKTGCITCLEGCWIAVTCNARYPYISPLRRFLFPNSRFRGRADVLPPPGNPVFLRYRILDKEMGHDE